MPLQGWDHLEFWVGNAKQAAYFYEHAFGFTRTAYAGPETGVRDRASYVLEQADIRFVLTTGVRADSEVTQFACRHGDGARDIALQVPSASEAYRQAVQRGARGIREPRWVEDDFGRIELASIGTYGDVIHTFVNRVDYAGPFMPGYQSTVVNGQPAAGVGLKALDHVVGNVELGRMDHWVGFYERVFGMTNIIHFGDDQIQTEYSALMSKVMSDGSGKIKFPINEPAEGKRKSEIEEDYGDLKQLRILADRDEDGYLLQIFTKTAQDRPTVFFEVIERHGATTFGEGNFKALFESIEREQALRGNL